MYAFFKAKRKICKLNINQESTQKTFCLNLSSLSKKFLAKYIKFLAKNLESYRNILKFNFFNFIKIFKRFLLKFIYFV